MNFLNILLQAPATGGSQWSGIIMMVVIVAIFYFFMIRPQQKKQKEIQKAREALRDRRHLYDDRGCQWRQHPGG